MAKYKDLHGIAIKAVSTDPSNAPSEGQVWYNTNTGAFKSILLSEAWSSTAPLSVARDKPGAAGTQTAILAIGGETALTSVDEYDGTGWKSAPAINTGRHGVASGGTTSAAWKAGGSPPETTTATEEYDGSSWTTVPGTLNTGRYILGSCGTQTAALCNGGYNTANVNNSEEYDGSSWSNGNAMNTARRTCADIGIQTAAVSFGGQPPAGPAQDDVEEYDGTSWTTVGNYPTNISDSAGSGTLTAGLAFGGNVPPSTTATKNYDGTTWTASPASLGTAAKRHGGTPSGTDAAAVAFGGDGPGSNTNISQEFNKSASVVTAGAWASGGALPVTINSIAGIGTQTAALGCGGYQGPTVATVYEYDGSSWSPAPSLGTARYGAGSNGTATAGLVYGGSGLPVPSAPVRAETEEYDGSSWSEQTDLSTARSYVSGFGTQTAGAAVGGASPRVGPSVAAPNSTEEYNGSSWTAGGNLNTIRFKASCAGQAAQTAGVVFGGYNNPPAALTNATEEYNGTSWTSVNNLLTGYGWGAAQSAGTQTDALLFGGHNALPFSVPTANTSSFAYDGTNFSTRPGLGTARGGLGGAGVSTAGLAFGGNPNTNKTEEFTGETTALNVKTLTRS